MVKPCAGIFLCLTTSKLHWHCSHHYQHRYSPMSWCEHYPLRNLQLCLLTFVMDSTCSEFLDTFVVVLLQRWKYSRHSCSCSTLLEGTRLHTPYILYTYWHIRTYAYPSTYAGTHAYACTYTCTTAAMIARRRKQGRQLFEAGYFWNDEYSKDSTSLVL